jgi:hypothetical protein
MIIEKGTLVIIKQNNLPFYLGLSNNKNELIVPKILPTNEILRNKICSADLLNGHEWRKVGCVVEIIKAPEKKYDEPSDMVRILSEMEKCTSNITFDG